MTSFVAISPGTRVLVTGATGFTGQALTKKLLAQGARVRAIARGSSDLSPFSGCDIEWVRGEVFNPTVISEAVNGIEYVFHVAAAYREAKISDAVYENVHVKSTQELARALRGRPEFQRFVHVSTVGVHGHIDEPPASETYRFSPGDIYQRTKAAAEVWLTEYAREQGLPYTVVRPAAIYGPGDKRLLKIFKMARRPLFPLFGKGKGLYHLIHVDDLTNIFIQAALHPRALGEAFIAGNADPHRLQDIVTTVADELGNSKITFVRFPAWPLFLAADVCEAVCKPLVISPPLYRRRVAFFTKDRAFDTRKLRDVLEYHSGVETQAGLRGTARWYREQGWL
jgi:dihydroflavonol-4-reductase